MLTTWLLLPTRLSSWFSGIEHSWRGSEHNSSFPSFRNDINWQYSEGYSIESEIFLKLLFCKYSGFPAKETILLISQPISLCALLCRFSIFSISKTIESKLSFRSHSWFLTSKTLIWWLISFLIKIIKKYSESNDLDWMCRRSN